MASSLGAGPLRVSWSLGARAVIRGVNVALHFLGSVASSSGNKEGVNLSNISRLNSNITSLSATLALL